MRAVCTERILAGGEHPAIYPRVPHRRLGMAAVSPAAPAETDSRRQAPSWRSNSRHSAPAIRNSRLTTRTSETNDWSPRVRLRQTDLPDGPTVTADWWFKCAGFINERLLRSMRRGADEATHVGTVRDEVLAAIRVLVSQSGFA